MNHPLRRWLIPLAVAFAIAVPALQAGLDLGLSAKAFAGDGDATRLLFRATLEHLLERDA